MTTVPKPPATWALETVFPAGGSPWNSQPCKVAPVGDLWTPDQGDVAEYRNWLDNSITAEQGSAHDRDMAEALQIWSASATAQTIQGGGATNGLLVGIRWDDYYKRWIIATGTTGGTSANVWASYDGGADWDGGGSTTMQTNQGDFNIDATGNILQYLPDGGSGTAGYSYWPGSSLAGTAAFITALNGLDHGGAVQAFSGGGKWLIWATHQSGATYTTKLVTAAVASFSGTFTDVTTSLPSAMQSATNHGGQPFIVASPGYLVGVIPGVTAGTDSASIFGTSDGVSFASVTPSALTGKIVTGLHYSTTDALFALVAYDGTSSYLYTTGTPSVATSWVLQKTFTGFRCDGVSSLGRAWVVSGVSAMVSRRRLLVSQDLGLTVTAGAPDTSTWAPANFPGLSDGGGLYVKPRFRSAGHQLAIWNDTNFRFSSAVSLTSTGGAY